MKKKLIITLAIISLLLATGCIPVTAPPVSEPTPELILPIPNSSTVDDNGIDTDTPDGSEVILPGTPPEDMTWISPGKVQVGNFYPGARAEWTLLVHNGNDTAASFAITYRYPDHVGEGYVKPIKEAENWVIIADTTPVIAPKETRETLVVLAMPGDAVVFAPKWEFWISVKDTTQTGMVQTELCSRWLVTMQ